MNNNNEVGVEDFMAWENGELDEELTVRMFQKLVNSGMAWQLQGMYGRQAKALLDAGLIELPEESHKRAFKAHEASQHGFIDLKACFFMVAIVVVLTVVASAVFDVDLIASITSLF